MTRLVHLTDLHFGLHRADLLAPLRAAVLAAAPDVVVVSGDLTQRALRDQYAQAMAFLRDLETPFLVIPGNHDLPAYNPLLRLFNPFRPFRKGASPDLTPTLHIGRVRIYAINTADALQWRGGTARLTEVDVVCRALRAGPPDVTNIAVCHHPLQEPPGFQRGETRNETLALQRFAKAGVHIVLSGHLHHWTTGLGITDQIARPIFQMQTGTALCARIRERDHGFAVMDCAADSLTVTRWIVDETCLRFVPMPPASYGYRCGAWTLRP